MILLNIGCGIDKIDGVINLDKNPECNPDILHDLEQPPLPFETESIDGIFASHILEHIRNLPQLLDELYRILKVGGVLNIKVPHYVSGDAWGDPTHVRAFSEQSFLPCYWPGWVIHEVSLVDIEKIETHLKGVHIHAQLVKGRVIDENENSNNES